jgi:subtilisin family serine protease
MDFYIDREPRGEVDANSANVLPPIPEELLARHGARILRPTDPISSLTGAVPTATVYRTDTLRIGRDVDTAVINGTLEVINLKVSEPPADAGDDVPRVVKLEVADPAKRATVDAWHALQHLQTAAAVEPPEGILRTAVSAPEPVALEHLLFTQGLEPVPWDSHGLYSDDSYVRTCRGGPVPVVVAIQPAKPRPLDEEFDRRPVIAVLDTGIASSHPWFAPQYQAYGGAQGQFVRELKQVQIAINQSSATGVGVLSATNITSVEDTKDESNPLLGELHRHVGHGSFIAGIVRQAAPDAQVAVARVLSGDGVAYERDVLTALRSLEAQVRKAQKDNQPDDMIDILCVSMGYYSETPQDEAETTCFAKVLDALAELGVLVVAAAGNDATTRRFYPAALADHQPKYGQPVISVGALNPNGTKAFFSNQASWVRAWATGVGLVSTFPQVKGGRGAHESVRALGRESLDPDDFNAGFAMWHGTSFAVPVAAGHLAEKLIEVAAGGLKMSDVSPETMRERAKLAVAACPKKPPS